MRMRIGQYSEHWRDMLYSWECWLDHLATVAAMIVLAIVVDTFVVWWKSRGAELSLWEKIQVASCYSFRLGGFMFSLNFIW